MPNGGQTFNGEKSQLDNKFLSLLLLSIRRVLEETVNVLHVHLVVLIAWSPL